MFGPHSTVALKVDPAGVAHPIRVHRWATAVLAPARPMLFMTAQDLEPELLGSLIAGAVVIFRAGMTATFGVNFVLLAVATHERP